ncbi:hypothetical protein [Cryobacterium sp. Y11]|uniref:hypothetical protein n=1 Tax=Cryobacterium sp. Y11 TaxID=2045016 RepID=UPI0011B07DF7|nr:hypothetical protein [Cryobacterium sp. Y11]
MELEIALGDASAPTIVMPARNFLDRFELAMAPREMPSPSGGSGMEIPPASTAAHRLSTYVWAALMLVTLIVTAGAESRILFEFGWLLLVICAVNAAQGLSWLSALLHKPHRNAP